MYQKSFLFLQPFKDKYIDYDISILSLFSCDSFTVSSDLQSLHSILIDPNNAVIQMVSVRPPISNSSTSLTKTLSIVPRARITIGITVTFLFYNYF